MKKVSRVRSHELECRRSAMGIRGRGHRIWVGGSVLEGRGPGVEFWGEGRDGGEWPCIRLGRLRWWCSWRRDRVGWGISVLDHQVGQRSYETGAPDASSSRPLEPRISERCSKRLDIRGVGAMSFQRARVPKKSRGGSIR